MGVCLRWRKGTGLRAFVSTNTSMNAWQEVLNYLKTKVNPQSYQTWLKPTRYSRSEGETLVVRVPNQEFLEWIQEHYNAGIQEALEKLRLGFNGIRYEMELVPEKKSPGNGEAKPQQGKLDFESVDHQLNARYTFDTFVVGSCNQFAHAAARAVAETPAKA